VARCALAARVLVCAVLLLLACFTAPVSVCAVRYRLLRGVLIR
jgi:hypothetical protein